MGEVYLAHDTTLQRAVAIKVLSREAMADREMAGRLLREARAASQLNHPGIVTIHEIGQADGTDFIVMERVEGRSLAEEIPPGGLPIERVLDVAGQIAAAVGAAHAAGIVHRDLKPANVIVTSAGRAKVLDFGLARVGGGHTSATRDATVAASTMGGIAGTIGYMSPEQIEGQPVGTRSDVFSLGIVMYEMITGDRPFRGDSDWAVMNATVRAEPAPVAARRPETPPELARIVTRCLARRPEDRYDTATAVAADLARIAAPAPMPPPARSSRALIVGVALAVVALGAIGWLVWRESRLHWARVVAPQEIAKLTARDDVVGAFRVARRAVAIAGNDGGVGQILNNMALTTDVDSDPPGAEVGIADYLGHNDRWLMLGRTPLRHIQIPASLLRWRLTKPGYDTLDVGQSFQELDFHLVPSGHAPRGMVLIPRGSLQLESTGQEVAVPDFWLDRFEVTNRDFKRFVDAGGYRRREFWPEPFVRDGRTLSWEEGVATFRDLTGRPGPATWELGTYPEGAEDDPVSGVSWYEAAAYARFAGRQLPTAYHWFRAAQNSGVFSEIVTASNFSGKGVQRVGSGGLGPYGTYDMAGNVKEWCWNATPGGLRYTLGGGWSEMQYMYQDEDAQSPFERRPTFGFRCMLQPESLAAALMAPITTFQRDPSQLKPVSDEVFEVYRHLYDYDARPLDVRGESVDNANPAWREERVSVAAAYGDERLPICLFIPKASAPPYQAVVFFPGSNAVTSSSSHNLALRMADFFVKSGRVLAYPIYKGTYERRREGPKGPQELREIMIDRGKDVRRAVDYLSSRRDVDSTKISFYGVSLGAQLAPVYLVIEPRFRTGVLFSGGFETWDIPAESDPVNFAPRVRQPVLMVNGREDFDLPYATAQVPLFKALGTPPDQKRHVVFEGGHIPPHPEQAMRVILDWMDQKLGPVK